MNTNHEPLNVPVEDEPRALYERYLQEKGKNSTSGAATVSMIDFARYVRDYYAKEADRVKILLIAEVYKAAYDREYVPPKVSAMKAKRVATEKVELYKKQNNL